MIGEQLGNFRILKVLGAGGMGEVYMAEHVALGTAAAIKVLHPEISKEHDHVQRFFNEARAVSKINHSGTVKIFDAGFAANGCAYLVMEMLRGEPLRTPIAERGPLPMPQLLDVAAQIANVLSATHKQGIVHRDLKPDNVFLVEDDEHERRRVKILDFGIAKLTGTIIASSPKTVGAMGTPAYMAPEQWGDAGKVDWRADAYSLGCMLFEMACGRPPFVASSIADFCGKHLSAPRPSLRSERRDAPVALDELVIHLMAREAEQRGTSMKDIERQLLAIVPAAAMAPTVAPSVPVAQTVPATTLMGSVGQITRERGNKRLVFQAFVGLTVVGIAVAVTAYVAMRKQTPQAAEPARDAMVAASTPSPIDAAESLRSRIDQKNPFSIPTGSQWIQAHAITVDEYELYQAFAADRSGTDPLRASSTQTRTWVTFEQAQAFCAAIDARLPDVHQWTKASGVPGPLMEWTGTHDEGLVTLLGGNATTENVIKKEMASTAGSTAKPTRIAGEIGFRCVR